MTPERPGPGRGGTYRPRSEEAEALALSIARELEEAEASQHLRAGKRRASRTLLGAGALLFSGWIWFLPPAAIVPPGAGSADPAVEVSALRFGLYLQVQQIEAFRRDAGRLPRELAEVAEIRPGIRYLRIAEDRYELRARASEQEVVYRSEETSFAGLLQGADTALRLSTPGRGEASAP